MGAERPDQRLVGGCGVRGDAQAGGDGELDGVPPTQPAAPVTPTQAPAVVGSASTASIAVSPFIGIVAASAADIPAGTVATWPRGTTTCSA
ncbi:hypothetical protein Psuf_071440 [Phytohabitans suffuscus]|uniref:Uncharacterized protein n=1 Tax=Phytohabitans suffuscus TaxID=624315 RepID=A0A6F8YVF7_9ACTN|nr:hypothetical protein [Phytohabitans suffuscus]BCB89831.1 hypothetical protein Psuf_071440 [Phytohabitans suffuscus]